MLKIESLITISPSRRSGAIGVNDCKSKPFDEFLASTSVDPAGRTQAASSAPAHDILRTSHLSDVPVGISKISCLHSDEGGRSSTLVFFTPNWPAEKLPADQGLHRRYRELLDHELVWDNYAAGYDQILLLMPYYQEVVERHTRHMTAGGLGRILDCGAGTGNVALRLAAAGLEVVAVDRNRAMLQRLRLKMTPELARRLTVIQANAESLPQLSDESFDGVTILLSLYDVQQPDNALAEAVRVLRPGGTLVITEPKHQFDLDLILANIRRHLVNTGRYEELKVAFDLVFRANQVLNPATRQTRSPLRPKSFINSLGSADFKDCRSSTPTIANARPCPDQSLNLSSSWPACHGSSQSRILVGFAAYRDGEVPAGQNRRCRVDHSAVHSGIYTQRRRRRA